MSSLLNKESITLECNTKANALVCLEKGTESSFVDLCIYTIYLSLCKCVKIHSWSELSKPFSRHSLYYPPIKCQNSFKMPYRCIAILAQPEVQTIAFFTGTGKVRSVQMKMDKGKRVSYPCRGWTLKVEVKGTSRKGVYNAPSPLRPSPVERKKKC